MKKLSNFENSVTLINEISSTGEAMGFVNQISEDEVLDGKHITVRGQKLVHFGSCSYLGLELDDRLKHAAIDAILKYGTLFSSSRIFISSSNYSELEVLVEKIFHANVLITSTVSLGHYSVMPIIIGSNDMVIYDQQAHFSMQDLMYKLKHNGTGIDILRHSKLEDLEGKIDQYKSRYDRIWYIIDGVYSMFGDQAPINDIVSLLNKHKKLWLYVDDAHGMSWSGQHGSGYVFSQTGLHKKMVVATSLAKGFGSCGGVFLFSDSEMRDKVRKWGGPYSHSGPQEPATVAAAIASAKIHLSEEIYELQKQLSEKIEFCNNVMRKHKVPLVYENSSPIFFVGCGLTKVGYKMVEKMMKDGFYTNIGVFPAVPETCTGVRFTITNHLCFDDIEKLAIAFAKNLPVALEEENRTMHDIYKAFRKYTDFEQRFGKLNTDIHIQSTKNVKILKHHSIQEIKKELWNEKFENFGHFDWDTLRVLEETFAHNELEENNWEFIYYIVYKDEKPILLSFFTISLQKDDLFTAEEISKRIEQIRQSSPYHLTSKTMMLGTPITNGMHLYIERTHPDWRHAFDMMLDEVWDCMDKKNINTLMFRDFDETDSEITQLFHEKGFIKIHLPENNQIMNEDNLDFESFFQTKIGKKQRYQIKQEIMIDIENYTVKIAKDFELNEVYRFYLNIKNRNLKLNTFDLPLSFFANILKLENWELVILFEKVNNSPISLGICHLSDNSYSPVIYGEENRNEKTGSNYKKMLLCVLQRGFLLKKQIINLGYTANETKKKFGAKQIPQIAFVQIKDKYNMDIIDNMAFNNDIKQT